MLVILQFAKSLDVSLSSRWHGRGLLRRLDPRVIPETKQLEALALSMVGTYIVPPRIAPRDIVRLL